MQRKDLKLSTIEAALAEGDATAKDAAIRATQRVEIPSMRLVHWLTSGNADLERAGLAGSVTTAVVPTELMLIIAKKLVDDGRFVEIRESFGRTLETRWLSVDAMTELAEADEAGMRYFAMRAAAGKTGDVYNTVIMNGLSDSAPIVAAAAAVAARGHEFTDETLDAWRQSGCRFRRMAAANAMIGRDDLPFRWIAEATTDDDLGVRVAAAKAAAERRIPERYVREWMNDTLNGEQALALVWNFQHRMKTWGDWRKEKAARRWLKFFRNNVQSKDARVATAATEIVGLSRLPLVRDREISGLVYKRCLEGVVVLAEIPSRAHIKITDAYNGVCSGRASEAIVREVIGDFYGEKVGISHYDHATQYREGDAVMVLNYDTSESRLDSTGFHFYHRSGLHDDYLLQESLELGY